jgi:hypothetical protein
MFQETGDRQNFQGRYVIRHPWKGEASCDVSAYHEELRKRQEREAQQLATLTGWDIGDIRARMDLPREPQVQDKPAPWWARLWD